MNCILVWYLLGGVIGTRNKIQQNRLSPESFNIDSLEKRSRPKSNFEIKKKIYQKIILSFELLNFSSRPTKFMVGRYERVGRAWSR